MDSRRFDEIVAGLWVMPWPPSNEFGQETMDFEAHA